MNAIFKKGDIVCALVNPAKVLLIRLFARNVYYCDVYNHPEEKEKVYFGRELKRYEAPLKLR